MVIMDAVLASDTLFHVVVGGWLVLVAGGAWLLRKMHD